MCGIVGIVGKSAVAPALYEALTMLQHRGQDAAGIATLDGYRIKLRKGSGLVRDVFERADMLNLSGNVGIGHVRYPTAGRDDSSEAQPFYVNSPYGIALAHNGNLINTRELTQELFDSDRRHLNTRSDSEVLLNVLAHELQQQNPAKLEVEHIFQAVDGVHMRCRGAYSALALISGHGVLGFRDPRGIRPAVLGSRETASGVEYAIASESVALDALGFSLMRDLGAGEAVFITLDGKLHTHLSQQAEDRSPCIFEYVYFSRPDSYVEGRNVYEVRKRIGMELAREAPATADMVVPVPDSGVPAALGFAEVSNSPFEFGIIRNHYVGRTFIEPSDRIRHLGVRLKHNPNREKLKGKRVVLVDDSIVRGTTSKKIVEMVRDAGATEVHFRIASPPTTHSCFYGVNTPNKEDLLAHNMDVEGMRDFIRADSLAFVSFDGLYRAMGEAGRDQTAPQFCDACFSGDYPIDPVDASSDAQNRQLSLLVETE